MCACVCVGKCDKCMHIIYIPIIFLVAFNPVLKLAKKLACPGFAFRIPIPDSEDLPPPDSTFAVLWDVVDSNEPSGWYKCTVGEYLSDSSVQLHYPNDLRETVHLAQVKCTFARKSAKTYYTLEHASPSPTTQECQACLFIGTHKVKAFADDMTLITSDKDLHRTGLRKIDTCARDLDLVICADKCFSLSIEGKKQDKRLSVHLQTGDTQQRTPGSLEGTWLTPQYHHYKSPMFH